jgi:hypothetical protein
LVGSYTEDEIWTLLSEAHANGFICGAGTSG